MKIASVIVSLVFAGVVAQATETAAPATTTAAPAAQTEQAPVAKAEKKAKKHHGKKEAKAKVEGNATEAAPAGH